MRKTQTEDAMNPTLESIQAACLEAGKVGQAIILAYAQGYATAEKKHRKEVKSEEKKEEE